MSKLLMIFITLSSLFSLQPQIPATIIASSCPLLAEASISSEIVTENVDGEEKQIYLMHGDEVLLVSNEGDFAYVAAGENSGYVYKYYLTQNSSQVVYPVFNGSTRCEAVIYDLSYTATQYKAKQGQGVYIYGGFGVDEGYTAVQVVLEDGTLYSGYIRDEDLSPNGISSLLITGIAIIAACVTIILSVVFIKKKKKKK